jgi:hypothetical protein
VQLYPDAVEAAQAAPASGADVVIARPSGSALYDAPAPAAPPPKPAAPARFSAAEFLAPTPRGRLQEGAVHLFDLAGSAFMNGATLGMAVLSVGTLRKGLGWRAWASALPTWCLVGGNVVMASALGKAAVSYAMGMGGGPLFAATAGNGWAFLLVTAGVAVPVHAWARAALRLDADRSAAGGGEGARRRWFGAGGVSGRTVALLLLWDAMRDVVDSGSVPEVGRATWRLAAYPQTALR